MLSLFDQVGADFIGKAIREFYTRVFSDPIIGHFFFHHDLEHLVSQQTNFACRMLGSTQHTYAGKSLVQAHSPLGINKAHFGRRQVVMAAVLADLGLAPDLARKWLALEDTLRPLIISKRS